MTWAINTRGPGHVLIGAAAYEALRIFRISSFVDNPLPLFVVGSLRKCQQRVLQRLLGRILPGLDSFLAGR